MANGSAHQHVTGLNVYQGSVCCGVVVVVVGAVVPVAFVVVVVGGTVVVVITGGGGVASDWLIGGGLVGCTMPPGVPT
jgi:hypothetical protein